MLAELDTRKIPYHDIKAKGARNKKVSGSTLMHMVAYENLRPSLSKNCMDTVQDLYTRCTSDDQSVRPTFEEIVQFLENDVRKETLVRAVRACLGGRFPMHRNTRNHDHFCTLSMAQNEEMNVIEDEQNGSDVSPEDLGVHHATRYVD